MNEENGDEVTNPPLVTVTVTEPLPIGIKHETVVPPTFSDPLTTLQEEPPTETDVSVSNPKPEPEMARVPPAWPVVGLMPRMTGRG